MEKLRAALIGVGVMGKKYARMICDGKVPHLELTAAVCRSAEAREWAKTLKGSVTVYESSDALFAEPEGYDVVIIATPHKTHPELACSAFALGKHVMCDKPAGISIGQAMNMSRAAKEADRVYGVMFHQRLYPKYIKLKEIIDSGELGRLSRIMLINSRYFRTEHYHKSGSWRSSWSGEGGGALINQGQHILDIWQWLFGMPEMLYADIPFGKYNSFAVDDEATIQMRYSNKLTAVFMLTTGEAVWQERLEVIGTRGKVLLEDDNLHIWRYGDSAEYMKKEPVNSRENLTVTEEEIVFDKTDESYIPMLENFAQSVISGRSLVARGENAVNALMLTNAAYYSAWKGEAVSLPIDAGEYDRLLKEHCNEESR